jgi:uncharacterized protein YaaQ
MMKMILAIMPTNLSEQVSQTLIGESYRVTKFASTAGLFSAGTTTLMVIAASEKIDLALDLIRSQIPPEPPIDMTTPRVTIYVLNVKDFEKV